MGGIAVAVPGAALSQDPGVDIDFKLWFLHFKMRAQGNAGVELVARLFEDGLNWMGRHPFLAIVLLSLIIVWRLLTRLIKGRKVELKNEYQRMRLRNRGRARTDQTED